MRYLAYQISLTILFPANLDGRSPENFNYIDLTFGSAEEVEQLQQLSLADQLVLCKGPIRNSNLSIKRIF